jgi:poly-gamma-glutamate synthesis protein (capsule biosynthesis protein)
MMRAADRDGSSRGASRPALNRRAFMLAALGSVFGATSGAAQSARPSGGAGPGPLRLALLGQCLIRHDLRRRPWPDLQVLSQRLRGQDVCFSDLEVVIRGPRAGAPTRDPVGVHSADPVVLDCLRDMGVGLLATSNNHAFDLGTGGILDTMAALRERAFPFAGTGESLAAAAAPVSISTANGRVALVAAAAGMIREGGAATPLRAGVHELRRAPQGGLEEEDVERMLASLRRARVEAEVVVAYLHNHLWEADVARTAEWQRAFARRAVDAGASVFVAHGPPLLHGIEMYRGAPLFHGLGSFIFQTRKEEGAYGEPNWESLIAECRFEAGRFVGAELLPVRLASRGEGGPGDLETRGRPSLAHGDVAEATLSRVASLSAALGHRLRRRDGRGWLDA